MTVLEVIQRSTEFLQKKGVDSPRLQAELLLAHHLQIPRMRLYLGFDRALAPQDVETVRELIKRRGQREPLQQIIGSTSFCGIEIALNRHVLVPRPETELLAEQAWNFLLHQALRRPEPLDVLDFGTGSGCLAVTLALKCAVARVTAIDVSPEALEVARHNAERHEVTNRVSLLQSDAFNALPQGGKFALVVSNPPYIPTPELEALQPEVRNYEPMGALDGGADGLRFYRQLAAEAGAWLEQDGRIMLEFGDSQAQPIGTIFEKQNWIVEKIVEDYTHRPRIFIAKPKTDKES